MIKILLFDFVKSRDKEGNKFCKTVGEFYVLFGVKKVVVVNKTDNFKPFAVNVLQ